MRMGGLVTVISLVSPVLARKPLRVGHPCTLWPKRRPGAVACLVEGASQPWMLGTALLTGVGVAAPLLLTPALVEATAYLSCLTGDYSCRWCGGG